MSLYGIPQVFNESVSAVTATNSVELGTRRSEGGIDYIYVYNSGAATISQGYGAYLPSASMSAFAASFVVTVSNAASQSGGEKLVGIAHNADIAASRYGWVATRGCVYASPDATATSANSGVELACGVDGGFVAAAVTLSTGLRIGLTLNSFVTTVGTGKIAFRSPYFG
jgi:hypothetical protein